MKKIFLIFSYLIIGSIYAIANNWAQTSDRINDLIKQEEYDAALELALPFAQRGNVNAQHIAGLCLLSKRELIKARTWLEKAINQGDVGAMYNMGVSYDNVNINWVPTHLADINKAKYYYQLAMSTTDNSKTSKFYAYMNYAAILYIKEKNINGAVQLLQSCLRQTEHCGIRRQLGAFYEEMGRPNDAFRMYSIAAKQGEMHALYQLGLAYMNPSTIEGLSINPDKKLAIECFTKIAEINDPNFTDFFGSKTGRAIRYLNSLYAELYYETYNETYLNQSIRWGSRYSDDLFVCDLLQQLYQEGLSDSKEFKTYDDWLKHIKKKYAIDSDVDVEVPIAKSKRPNTYVLIVANEDYEFEAKVPFAARDGNIFFKYINQTLGVPKENIRLLTNASLNKFKYELSWFNDVLKTHPKSKAIVFYAGHGLPSEDSTTSYLLPTDGYAKNVHSGLDISEIISSVSKNSEQSLFIFDACFSGAKRDGKMITAARGVAIKQSKPILQNNSIVFSACSGTETAYSYDDQQHGLFTYYLLKSLKDNKGKITLGELSDHVISEVTKTSIDVNKKIQTPNITVSDDIKASWRNIDF